MTDRRVVLCGLACDEQTRDVSTITLDWIEIITGAWLVEQC